MLSIAGRVILPGSQEAQGVPISVPAWNLPSGHSVHNCGVEPSFVNPAGHLTERRRKEEKKKRMWESSTYSCILSRQVNVDPECSRTVQSEWTGFWGAYVVACKTRSLFHYHHVLVFTATVTVTPPSMAPPTHPRHWHVKRSYHNFFRLNWSDDVQKILMDTPRTPFYRRTLRHNHWGNPCIRRGPQSIGMFLGCNCRTSNKCLRNLTAAMWIFLVRRHCMDFQHCIPQNLNTCPVHKQGTMYCLVSMLQNLLDRTGT